LEGKLLAVRRANENSPCPVPKEHLTLLSMKALFFKDFSAVSLGQETLRNRFAVAITKLQNDEMTRQLSLCHFVIL
jgi:hypothetical protein